MEKIFQIKNVSYQYAKRHQALSDVSFEVQEGEIFSIIGSNGSGKSTLLHLMNGLLFPDSGTILYKDQLLTESNFAKEGFNSFFRQSNGYIFQNSDSQLFCPTVFDEMLFGPLQMGLDEQTATQRAEEVMLMLNVHCLRDRPSYMLSGGEKKKVAIGSVLTMNPDVLLMDEPMSGLDPKTRSDLIELIFDLNEAGKTIIIATHHLELVDHLQSRVAVLSEQHRLEKIGIAEDILSDVEFLKRMNLIQESIHRHGNIRHKHLTTGFLSHRHNH